MMKISTKKCKPNTFIDFTLILKGLKLTRSINNQLLEKLITLIIFTL